MGAVTIDDTHDPTPFVRRDGARNRIELAVTGARCAGCIQAIESGMGALPGVRLARMNLSTGKLVVEWEGLREGARGIVERLAGLGFPAKAFDPAAVRNAEDAEARLLLRCLAVAGFAAGNVMLFSVSVWAGADMDAATRGLFHWLSALIAIPAVAYAGRPFFRSAFAALSRGRTNMDVPITLGVVLATGMSIVETAMGAEHAFFDAAVMLLFFLLTGRYLDHQLRAQARSAANDLLRLQSATATRIETDGRVASVAAKDVRAGDRLLVAPGERLAADGILETAGAEFDLSLLTGESELQTLAAGVPLRGGALNRGRPVTVRATAAVETSYVADLARLLEAAEQSRGGYVRIAERAARVYVPVVHGLAATAFLWALWSGLSTHDAIMRAVTLLIITCPCALGLAVPAVQIVAAGRLFRKGLLVKSGDALERLALADTVIFDKTGTLTLGRPQLTGGEGWDAATLEEAARLARTSRHPLARALAAAAGPGVAADGVQEVPGLGLEACVGGAVWKLGRAAFAGADADAAAGSALYFRKGQGPVSVFRFGDRLRQDAAHTLQSLSGLGLSVEMLSGDRNQAVSSIAAEAGVSDWRAEASPEDKIAHVRALKAAGRTVLMIGDGLNDAAALAEATVSLSPGEGADVTQAAADFVLQGSKLAPVADAVRVARAAQARVRENLIFSVLYNAFAVPLAFAGWVTPLVAAVAMSGSSLIVTLNALRLAREEGAQPWTR
jgi:Cu2+-exporting ATPase